MYVYSHMSFTQGRELDTGLRKKTLLELGYGLAAIACEAD